MFCIFLFILFGVYSFLLLDFYFLGMKIKSFDIQHTNTSTPGHVTLTCLVDVSKDTEKLNIELYRVYASYRTKLKKQVGGQRLIFTIHNITCDDLGVYECQGHQTGIQQRVWAQKLLEFQCK